ncbi:MAG: NADH-quinone oxidoreductase subunit A [Candidatus Poseidoniia archaeon]|jgi:NADH-quinone oxidoreductase subunit A|nr:NADH-quinone oxidoreductase subunit A [Candidatus Poseidoniia archaeon]|tara:strand:- start:2001 stop:2360 length:360 start_codon:yes stop_codon:yes gene_type:complete
MASDFLPLLALAGFGAVATLLTLIIPALFAPSKHHPMKAQPFESGQIPTGEGRLNFMMQYYAYLLMFLVFDVMLMFIFAWAASYFLISFSSAGVIILFLVILFVPMGYTLHLAGRRELW